MRFTNDFDRWPDLWQWAFTLPEPTDPSRRGTGMTGGQPAELREFPVRFQVNLRRSSGVDPRVFALATHAE